MYVINIFLPLNFQTGKTYTLVEIIRQLVLNEKKKVLVCGPSHVSVGKSEKT